MDNGTQTLLYQEWSTDNAGESSSVIDQVTKVAESALLQTGFVYEKTTGLYYHYDSGYYYDAVCIKILMN